MIWLQTSLQCTLHKSETQNYEAVQLLHAHGGFVVGNVNQGRIHKLVTEVCGPLTHEL